MRRGSRAWLAAKGITPEGALGELLAGGDPIPTPPAAALSKPDEPRSPYLDYLEKKQRGVRVTELVTTVVAPDDSGQPSSASPSAAAGASS